jgi:hypothetical protein
MTSQGTPHGRFTCAIANGNLRGAEMAARELGSLTLDDALKLCVLLAERDLPRFDRAALRWLERFIAEQLPTLPEVALAAVALAELRYGERGAGVSSLERLARRASAA